MGYVVSVKSEFQSNIIGRKKSVFFLALLIFLESYLKPRTH